MVWIYIYKRGNYGINFCYRGVHSEQEKWQIAQQQQWWQSRIGRGTTTTMGAGHHRQGDNGEMEWDNNEGTAMSMIAPQMTTATFMTPLPHFAWEQGFFLFLLLVLIQIFACTPLAFAWGGIRFFMYIVPAASQANIHLINYDHAALRVFNST